MSDLKMSACFGTPCINLHEQCNGPLGKDMSSDELCTVWQVGSSVDTKEKYIYKSNSLIWLGRLT